MMWTAFDSLRIWPRGGLLWTLMNLPAQKKKDGRDSIPWRYLLFMYIKQVLIGRLVSW
jgi:hypothetical protein